MKRDPESLLGTEDGDAYERFVDWSVGDGFDLAIIKMTRPVDRQALIAWTKERVPAAREIDLKQVGTEKSRLWDLLVAARDEEGATMLILHGLEEAPTRQRTIAQLNVERDELVQAFAMPWVLFVHPATYPELLNKAPDFVDFAGLWLDEVPTDELAVLGMPRLSPNLEVASDGGNASGEEMDLLTAAAKSLRYSRLDEARDLLARYDLAQGRTPDDDLGGVLARCLSAFLGNRHEEAMLLLREKLLPHFDRLAPKRSDAMTYIVDILRLRGEWDEALRLAKEYLLPTFECRGDAYSRAITLGRMADVLVMRGELDEVLRIRREEVLPVYERLGDVHTRALTLGKIADVLEARGELDEVLRIRREEELPVYERLGDVHSRAATLGQIADVLAFRGELDEALRIRREEELPIYERLRDARSRALTLGKIADALTARDDLDEALRIRREEELPVYERLGDVRAHAIAQARIADLMAMRGEFNEGLRIRRESVLPVLERLVDVRGLIFARCGLAINLAVRGHPEDRAEIVALLTRSLHDARRLRLPREIEKIETIISVIGLDPHKPPFAAPNGDQDPSAA